MGGAGSKITGKLANSFSFGDGNASANATDGDSALTAAKASYGGYSGQMGVHHMPVSSATEFPPMLDVAGTAFIKVPVVLTRRGSMYFDEDGDLAHEFYVEAKMKGGYCYMRRIHERDLEPQGDVAYSHPRLPRDCPILMC